VEEEEEEEEEEQKEEEEEQEEDGDEELMGERECAWKRRSRVKRSSGRKRKRFLFLIITRTSRCGAYWGGLAVVVGFFEI